MPPELSAAQLLLESARRDLAAVEALLDNTTIHDSTIGFHAQQTVEKALKAVLSAKGIVFRRTHDLAELLDLIADSQIAPPPAADTLDELNPYAVEARYGVIDVGGLNRGTIFATLNAVLQWAQSNTAALA